jgi:hypothetical protein
MGCRIDAGVGNLEGRDYINPKEAHKERRSPADTRRPDVREHALLRLARSRARAREAHRVLV